jgi:hypothetical protein
VSKAGVFISESACRLEISADYTDFVSDSLRTVVESLPIDRFEKTATEFFVNLESSPDDLIGLNDHDML